MIASIERPDWDDRTALVPTGDGGAALSVEPARAFSDQEVERRYRSMVASRMTKASLPADEARTALDPALVAEWEASGGFTTRLARAQKNAIAILDRLDPEGRTEFISVFDSLPEGVRSALFSEIALGSTGSARIASDADVIRFASTPEGGAMVKEWGHRANRNVAVIRDRINRILGRMAAGDVDAATAWFDALSATDAAAIYRMLVAK